MNICSIGDIAASEGKGKELAAKQAGKPKKYMAAHLYGSIMLYTGNAIYRQLNAALRSAKRKNVQKYFKYLRLLLEALNTLPQKKCTLWRGISCDLTKACPVGKTVTWWSVSSCTSTESVARDFASGSAGVATLFTIKAKRACPISAISFYSSEAESLLPPGTQLLIKSVKKVGKLVEIHAEEVGNSVG